MKNLRSQIGLRLGAWLVLGTAGVLTPVSASAAMLTRSEAVSALFAPGSGVTIDTTDTAVWSPFEDFGFGPGNEGLLPADAQIDPHALGWLPFPGPGMTNAEPAYFFWLDDLPAAHFQHPTRFVLVRADVPAPTVDNGRIRVSLQGWWPRIVVPPSLGREYFSSSDLRVSAVPPGASNPDGLIAGPGYVPPDPMPAVPALEPVPPLAAAAPAPNNACGLIIRGSGSSEFGNDVELFERDLINHHGVSPGRIIKANGGATASSNDVFRAITNLCALQPPCDKIYIRATSHGSIGSLCLAGGPLPAASLCRLFQMLAAKGVPICLFMEACHSASLPDAHRWNFPAGSTMIFSANTNADSWGHAIKFTDSAGGCVTNSLFVDAFSRCLNDPALNRGKRATEAEAIAWVLANRPCYTWTGDRKMYYPANPPAGGGPNPDPQIVTVGGNPTNININVCNATGSAQSAFHLIFKGDVRGGVGLAWESDANDRIGNVWGHAPTITYDPARDETMVCWNNAASPVPAGGYIHFGYFRREGGLRPARQGWGSAVLNGPPANRVPSAEKTFRFEAGGAPAGVIRIAARGIENGGWGDPLQAQLAVRFLPHSITLEELNLGNPEIANQQPMILGSAFLLPDTAREFQVPLPPIPPGQTAWLILETRLAWETSNNQSVALELFPVTPPIPPSEMFITRLSNGRVAISWTGNGILQSAPDVLGPWQNMPTSGQSVVLPVDGPQRFFRLQTSGSGN